MKTNWIEDRGSRMEDRLHRMIEDQGLSMDDRETQQSSILNSRSPIILTFALFLIITPCAFGQARGGQAQGQSVPLPLSGRSGLTGAVSATESPVPGTTTSVNTINPTIQVQGPYAG